MLCTNIQNVNFMDGYVSCFIHT